MLSDTRNRKKFFVASMLGVFAIMTAMIFTTSLDVMLFLFFMQGALCSARMNVGYIYLMELVPK